MSTQYRFTIPAKWMPSGEELAANPDQTFIPNEIIDEPTSVSLEAWRIYVYVLSYAQRGESVSLEKLAAANGKTLDVIPALLNELKDQGWIESVEEV